MPEAGMQGRRGCSTRNICAGLQVSPVASLPISSKERSNPMNPGVIKLILLAVEAVCVLVVTAVTVSDSVKKNKDNKK
ncbi:MAG TPA: hypothetical protein DET40_02300 [Lentisphaeria bacterium]|nr:MAG: hypothetical protein A2X45_16900 [Lentisphaerae bacterium GWF2_50_93]HCE42363.1 hypothetical protein [Lentisphaeria bacterium]